MVIIGKCSVKWFDLKCGVFWYLIRILIVFWGLRLVIFVLNRLGFCCLSSDVCWLVV